MDGVMVKGRPLDHRDGAHKHPHPNGALLGGPQCRMLILRNLNVACRCRLFPPMSHVEFKKGLCPISL